MNSGWGIEEIERNQLFARMNNTFANCVILFIDSERFAKNVESNFLLSILEKTF